MTSRSASEPHPKPSGTQAEGAEMPGGRNDEEASRVCWVFEAGVRRSSNIRLCPQPRHLTARLGRDGEDQRLTAWAAPESTCTDSSAAAPGHLANFSHTLRMCLCSGAEEEVLDNHVPGCILWHIDPRLGVPHLLVVLSASSL